MQPQTAATKKKWLCLQGKRLMKAIYSFVIISLFFLQCKPETISGTVVKVADGDTFTVLTADKRTVKIRLYGIDAPEKNQDFYRVSRDHLASLTMHKEVKIVVINKDRYNRTVGRASVSGEDINEAMLKAGLAWHYTEYDNNPEWANLEQRARRERLGIWSMPHPVPPWQFRKKQRTAKQ